MQELKGLGASDGVAIAKAVCISTRIIDIYQIPIPESEVEEEVERFSRAVEQSREEIQRLRDKVGEELGTDLAGIFDAQALFLFDSSFLNRVLSRIRDERVNAEWALHETASEIQTRFDEIDTEHLRERSEDLRDVCRYLIQRLRGIQGAHLHQLSEIGDDIVIVADDLTPSDAVRLGRQNVAGFVIEHGSRTSHTTIIAKSLNIPLVTGVKDIRKLLTDQIEMPIIVDGTTGTVFLNPNSSTVAIYRGRRLELERLELELLVDSALKPISRDGVEIAVMANIDLPEEIAQVRRYGAAGIGLYRSEFLYIEKSPELPTEEEHLEIYRSILQSAAPDPAIIRTYDLGGRKIASEVMETHEANPVLGLRGIRLLLSRPNIFRTQVRALFRAGCDGELWVMLPMVTIVEEVRQFRAFADEIMDELEREGTPFCRDYKLGIMIEVPCAALTSDILAREVDFFSIGTNDLIQYSLAVDRSNEHVADLYRPLHPGVLRMLRMVAKNAQEAGIELSMCGEMASDIRMLPVLLGCGLRRLSVSPRRAPAIKRRVRDLVVGDLAEVAEACSNMAIADEVDEYLWQKFGDTLLEETRDLALES